ncbi:hypothetical protein [Microlunatus ginsengisoli]|uniref:ATP-binding protein n=1 Tax=Microlunatus ginsengisoli TaxID=363863 RepID=A0ABP6ZCZ3_9ACTN
MTLPDTEPDAPAELEELVDESPNRRQRRRADQQRRREEQAQRSARRRQGPAAALFGTDPDPEERDDEPAAGHDGVFLADRGQWDDLKGPVPRGLRRYRFLDRLGWYEVADRDATITSTRQVVATNPALIRSQPPFSGGPTGLDEQTGMYVGSDPFVLYDRGIVESINVVLVGDVGVTKSSFVKNHYLQDAIYAGRQVCCFDRKRNRDRNSEYDPSARIVEASGKRVARIRFDRAGNGARVNILDPRIIARGGDQYDTVGQDELLQMVAELLHGPLTSEERFALSAAHRQAMAGAAREGRVPVLSDVVDALFQPDLAYLPAALAASGHVGAKDMLGYGLRLGFDLHGALDGTLSGLIDGPTRDADGHDLDLGAVLIVVHTSSLQDGSAALMLVMAIMSTFISSVWSMSPRQSVVIIEEGYTADFPSVAAILRSLAKRGRGVGVSLVLVLHHLSDIDTDSPLAALFRETGVIHLLRQAQLAEAKHTNDLLGLGDLTETIQQLAKGTHILIEGRPELRPPRVVCHVRTDLDRWANYTDAAITGGADAPPGPFDEDDDAPAAGARDEVAADDREEVMTR